MSRFRNILAALLTSTLFISGCARGNKPVLKAKSSDLKKTIISAHMEEKITSGKNIIYCSSFQLAWNEFKNNITKGDILLEGNPPLAEYLNKSLNTKKDLSEDSYVAMVGMKKDDIISKINAALKTKFRDDAPKVEDDLKSGDDILAYAYISKNLEFKKQFEKLDNFLYFDNTSVKAFGVKKYSEKHAEIGKQVEIKYYDPSTPEFIVSLSAKDSSDEIILAEISPQGNLLETYEHVESLIAESEPSELMYDDVLAIPKFDFLISHSYNELLNKPIQNAGYEDYFFFKALQETRFKLDEKGVKLRSEVHLGATKGAPSLSRMFVFNKPFLFYLKEKNAAYPYFMMWIDNPEILIKK